LDPSNKTAAANCAVTPADERPTGPLISIVIAVFNGAEHLQRSIGSVVDQTYPNKELIIIDGGSSDGTIDIIKAHQPAIAHWETKPDRGIYHAWNKALVHTQGEWVYFLGADDYLCHAKVLSDIAFYLAEYSSETRIVYGRVHQVAENGDLIGTFGDHWERLRHSFKAVMSIPHQGVFHHRSLFETHGRFDESYRIAGDYEMLLRELKSHAARFVPGVQVANMQYGGMSSSPLHAIHTLREIARSRKKHKVRGIALLWHWTFLKANIRYLLNLALGEKTANYIANKYRVLTNRTPIR
jgi:glycosyltransferase involved in cell wall biosynthesis